jgi:hypothetical protein
MNNEKFPHGNFFQVYGNLTSISLKFLSGLRKTKNSFFEENALLFSKYFS